MKSLKKITPFLWYLPVKILKKHTEYEWTSFNFNEPEKSLHKKEAKN